MSKRCASSLASFATLIAIASTAAAGSLNGVAGSMPAFYDGKLFTINFKAMPEGGTTANLTHNASINTIYVCDQPLAGGGMFVDVLDAIQGDGFNPLWQEVVITFNEGHPVRQITKDDDVTAAAVSGEVSLSPSGELYRCSVIGKPSATAASLGRSAGGATPAGTSGTQASSWGSLKRRFR